MKATRIEINTIPALVWGEPSEKVLLCVHGKMGAKECVEGIAEIAREKGYQTVSFDLPQHGERKDEAERCDMEYLIVQMMQWFDVSAERLCREQEVDTPIDVLSWNYFQYVKAHPVNKWNVPTCILYAGKDNLQSRDVVNKFVERFGCRLIVSEQSGHPFMEDGDGSVVAGWLRENIQ